jgi:hypothetical protein
VTTTGLWSPPVMGALAWHSSALRVTAPTLPDPAIPKQIHLDIMVEDVAAAGRESRHSAA